MIQTYRAQHPQAPLQAPCASLDVSRSWFYARPTRQEPTQETLALRQRVEEIVLEFPGYGYRRVTAQLHKEGWRVNHKRILRQFCRLRRVSRPASSRVRISACL